jgi:uncharacterized protein (TIGR03000 family)
VVVPAAPAVPIGPTETLPPPKPGQGAAPVPAPAKINVTLPENARLTIDNQPTRSTSERRVFVTPDLQPGKTFYYNLKAEVDRDGKTEVLTQRVTVRAGEESRVLLTLPSTATASK